MRAFLLLLALLLPVQAIAQETQETQEFPRPRDWYRFPSEAGLAFSMVRDEGATKLVILAGKTPETFILTLERVDCAAGTMAMIGMNGSVNRDRISILMTPPEVENDRRTPMICDSSRWVPAPDPFAR